MFKSRSMLISSYKIFQKFQFMSNYTKMFCTYKFYVPSRIKRSSSEFRQLSTNLNMCKTPLVVHHLKDYKKPDYFIKHIDLDFTLDFTETYVGSEMQLYRSPQVSLETDLILDGHSKIDLLQLWLKMKDQPYQDILNLCHLETKHNTKLIVPHRLLKSLSSNEIFHLKTLVKINPTENTDLQGLYKSQDMLCTHCEADGFQAITFYLDRPDVMATMNTILRAPKNLFPVLLCNGNYLRSEIATPIPQGVVTKHSNLHTAVFKDPHKKPSYLFAIVAGNLSNIRDTFQTCEGVHVELNLWCEPQEKNKLSFALDCLKKAMKWDENKFGRAFDLNVFHLVAISHFNMGAMENKGLNLFNSNCLLANKDTSTDNDFLRVLTCVSHEYFHNWTGNRVTCRDWFQITLKEGLTVYREQRFMEDCYSKAMSRIENVNVMQSVQAEEDAGPTAHPIQPKSYTAVDNFYTVTVYTKGSEVVRMYATILGEEGFRKGMDLYFKRHDGQAVTCDDFRHSMADANGVDLSQFERWYRQVGTPIVSVLKSEYDERKKEFLIELKQELPSYGVLDVKNEPLHIPILIGLIGKKSHVDLIPTQLLELKEETQQFIIQNVSEQPIVSLLRNYSAPVKIVNKLMDDKDYGCLMAYDTDPVNRWYASRKLTAKAIINTAKSRSPDSEEVTLNCSTELQDIIYTGLKECLDSGMSRSEDLNFVASILTPPSLSSLMQELDECDPVVLSKSKTAFQNFIYSKFKTQIIKLYESLKNEVPNTEYTIDSRSQGIRSLKNVLLNLMTQQNETDLAYQQFKSSTNLTDRLGALKSLSNDYQSAHFQDALDTFFRQWGDDSQCLEKYFLVQTTANHPSVLDTVKSLLNHPKFQKNNPNHIRYVVEAYANNLEQFHRKDGQGYKFLADFVLNLDEQNSRLAARIATHLIHFKRLDALRQNQIIEQLQKIIQKPNLSLHTSEIVSKALNTIN